MEALIGIIGTLGYPGLFLSTLLMFMIFPLPAQPIMLLAGILVSRGEMNFPLALLFSTFGAMAGAFINYFIAFYLGRRWMVTHLSAFINGQNLGRMEWFFNRYGVRALFIGLSIPSIGQVITLPAGLAGMNLKIFTVVVFFGSLTWCAYLIGLGLFFGDRIDYIKEHLTLIGSGIGITVIFMLLSFYVLRKTIFKYYRTIRWRDAHEARKQQMQSAAPTA